MSLNLHAIVRGAISSVNADEQVYLLQSTGNTNVSGRIVATIRRTSWSAPRCRPYRTMI